MFGHLLIRLLAIVFLATVASCRGLHGLPRKSDGTYIVILYSKAQIYTPAETEVEQANMIKTAPNGNLRLKTLSGVVELAYYALDSFSVGNTRYIVITDTTLYPHRTVSPFYKVERQLTDSTLLLSNTSTMVKSGISPLSSGILAGYVSTGVVIMARQPERNVATAMLGGALVGIAIAATDFIFKEIIAWPTYPYLYEYNTNRNELKIVQ